MVKRKKPRLSAGDKVFYTVNTAILFFVAFVTAYPLLYVVYKSLTSYRNDPVTGERHTYFDLGAYSIMFKNDSIFSAFFLTVGVVIVSTVLHILVTVLAAYAISKKNLPGRKGMLVFVVITMVFNGGLMPYYVLIGELGLRNNIFVYIIPGLVSGFNLIITKNFFTSLPPSLEESAKIDGADDFKTLFSIVLPMSKPIISTVALWFAVAKWNDWMTGVLYMSKGKYLLLQNVLRDMLIKSNGMNDALGMGQSENYLLMDNVKMAVIVIATIPIVCIYPFVQKYFIKGVMLGSVKE